MICPSLSGGGARGGRGGLALQRRGQEVRVAAVGFEEEVEDVAKHRDRPHAGVDGRVADHLEERGLGDVMPQRNGDDIGGRDQHGDVPDAGDEADDAVEPEAEPGPGQAVAGVEETGNPLDPGEGGGGMGCGLLWRENVEGRGAVPGG